MEKTKKVCKRCRHEKIISEFFDGEKYFKQCNNCRGKLAKKQIKVRRKRKDQDRCCRCGSKLDNEWRYTNCNKCTEHNRLWLKEKRLKIREKVFNAYGGAKCVCCGETENEFLGIDHINGGGYLHRRQIQTDIYSWLVRNKFPSGFRVLCHNCNLSIGFYGFCPHEKYKRSSFLLSSLYDPKFIYNINVTEMPEYRIYI